MITFFHEVLHKLLQQLLTKGSQAAIMMDHCLVKDSKRMKMMENFRCKFLSNQTTGLAQDPTRAAANSNSPHAGS